MSTDADNAQQQREKNKKKAKGAPMYLRWPQTQDEHACSPRLLYPLVLLTSAIFGACCGKGPAKFDEAHHAAHPAHLRR